MTPDSHRPQDPWHDDYGKCWAGEGILVCDKPALPNRLGLCQDHHERLMEEA